MATVYRAACEFFGQPVEWDSARAMPQSPHPQLSARTDCDDEDALRDLVLTVYDIEADDRRLRQIIELSPSERGVYFDQLRKTYPVRREFQNTLVETTNINPSLRVKIAALGFRA
jgi:erythronate-4-phosphate dehydrogenase